MIVGSHGCAVDTPENKDGGVRRSMSGTSTFAHSPTSWKAMWWEVFEESNVVLDVWTMLVEVERKDLDEGKFRVPWMV